MNKDDIINSSSDINDVFNKKECNKFDNFVEVENKEDISDTIGDCDNNEKQERFRNGNNTYGYFKGPEATIEDLKDIGVNLKKDIIYYTALSGGALSRMEVIHNIHTKNGHTLENNIGTIYCFYGASYQIF